MSKFTIKYTPHKIREIIKLKRQIETKQDQPYFGEIEGYKFVLNNIEEPNKIFKEYQKTHSKIRYFYTFDSLPLVGDFFRKKAWKLDGYQAALAESLGVQRQIKQTESGETHIIKDAETGTVLHEKTV